ncbi:MAG: hypothetical protein VYA84_15060 [Planctomycetota bacterium]|nr:hypothetical protein [Planctomycetota bacterium]
MRPSEVGSFERVKLYADAIQAALRDLADQNPSLAGVAKAITSVYLCGDQALVVNVGDYVPISWLSTPSSKSRMTTRSRGN